MFDDASKPLVGQKKTISRGRYVLFFVVLVILVGALCTAKVVTRNGDISSAFTPPIMRSLGIPAQAPEAPVAALAIAGDITAAALLDGAKGGVNVVKHLVGAAGMRGQFMKATGTDYCWSSTAFNAVKIAAFHVFAASTGTTDAGFIRKNKDNVEKNISDELATWIVRMKVTGGSSRSEPCGDDVWTKNGDIMGTTQDVKNQKGWPCYGWGSATRVIEKLGLSYEAPGTTQCSGEICRNKIKAAFDDATNGVGDKRSVIVGCTYGTEGYMGQGSIIHYMLIAGYKTIDDKDWFIVLNPSGVRNGDYTDDDLQPFALRELVVKSGLKKSDGSGPRKHPVQILIHPTAATNYIVSYMIVNPVKADRTKLSINRDNFAPLQPR